MRKEAVKGKKAVVLPWWKGERGCWDVEVLVSRVSTLSVLLHTTSFPLLTFSFPGTLQKTCHSTSST